MPPCKWLQFKKGSSRIKSQTVLPAPPLIQSFAPEILDYIFCLIPAATFDELRVELLQILRVCRLWHCVALRHIYHSVFTSPSTLFPILRTLKGASEAKLLVQEIILRTSVSSIKPPSEWQTTTFSPRKDTLACLEMLGLCPNLTKVEIVSWNPYLVGKVHIALRAIPKLERLALGMKETDPSEHIATPSFGTFQEFYLLLEPLTELACLSLRNLGLDPAGWDLSRIMTEMQPGASTKLQSVDLESIRNLDLVVILAVLAPNVSSLRICVLIEKTTIFVDQVQALHFALATWAPNLHTLRLLSHHLCYAGVAHKTAGDIYAKMKKLKILEIEPNFIAPNVLAQTGIPVEEMTYRSVQFARDAMEDLIVAVQTGKFSQLKRLNWTYNAGSARYTSHEKLSKSCQERQLEYGFVPHRCEWNVWYRNFHRQLGIFSNVQ